MNARSFLLPASALAVTGALTVGLPASAGGATTSSAPSGYRLIFGPDTPVADGRQASSTVHCPSGTVPMGGGAIVDTVSLAVAVNSSFPTKTGWTVIVNNSSGGSDAFRVAVTCATKPAHYAVVASKPVGTPSPHRTTVTVSCPTSAKPLGGGAQSNGSTSVDLGGSRPFQNGWRITEENLTATLASRVIEPGPTVKAFAVCGSVPGYRLVTGSPQTVLPSSQATVTATCPTGSVVLGGGASIKTSSIGLNFNESAPNEQTIVTAENGPNSNRIFAWETLVNNNNEVTATAAPFAICAGR